MGLTTDPSDPDLGRGLGGEGMNKTYLVLSEEERARGFVRPVRRGYVHVGRGICGRPSDLLELIASGESSIVPPDGTVAYLCSDLPGHEGECTTHMPVTAAQLAQFEQEGNVGGCGAATFMAEALAETYARDPAFYGATFCARCNTHLRVGARGEFVWADDDGSPLPLWVGT